MGLTGEVYVPAQSQDRVNKERGMRRRQLGAAEQQAPSAWRFVEVQLPAAKKNKKPKTEPQANLKLRLPEQPPPRITAKQVADSKPAWCRLFKSLV